MSIAVRTMQGKLLHTQYKSYKDLIIKFNKEFKELYDVVKDQQIVYDLEDIVFIISHKFPDDALVKRTTALSQRTRSPDKKILQKAEKALCRFLDFQFLTSSRFPKVGNYLKALVKYYEKEE